MQVNWIAGSLQMGFSRAPGGLACVDTPEGQRIAPSRFLIARVQELAMYAEHAEHAEAQIWWYC
ncbi:hypothetical protein PG994_011507 [Apiospora phragmitis]|uniref:Uncharacterized protein n=1 Tax=Apiospora phragmitis TaxID=2905665 RepID=A0ABR1TTB3_9PEZI